MTTTWEFCPHCGGKLHKRSHRIHGICTVCGQTWWRNPKPTTGALILDETGEKILLVQRSIEPGSGLWDVPGGFVEENELPLDGVVREVQEELGVEIEDIRFLGFYGPTPYQYGHQRQLNLDIFFLARLKEGSRPKPADDASDYRWFDIRKPLPPMGFESVAQAIADIKNSKLNVD